MSGSEQLVDSGFTLTGDVAEFFINTGFEQNAESDDPRNDQEVLVGDMLMIVDPIEHIHRRSLDTREKITAHRISELGGASREW